MQFKPRHVLIGELDSDSLLRDAEQFSPYYCSWVVPKGAKQGDSVVVLIGKKFVSNAVIREDAKPSQTPGEYHSTLGAVRFWGDLDVLLDDVKEQIPEWKYLSYPRNYTSVPPEFQEPLLAALHQAAEWAEQRLEGTEPLKTPIQEEVISVPCGRSIHISEDTGVHACPNEFPWSPYRKTRYMALRHSGGIMKRVYEVEHTIILPHLAADLHLVPDEYRERVQIYIKRRQDEWNFTGSNFKFYILSLENPIELPHCPRPQHTLQGHCYFWLLDLCSGEKVVQVSSKLSGVALPEKVSIKSLRAAIVAVEAEHSPLSELENSPLPHTEDFEVEVFDPETLNDAREYLARQIVARRGQPQFRQKLVEAYEGQCAFTGYFPTEALEAAHIIPYCGTDSDNVANGLLLRSDIHTLFDQGLISVDISNSEQFTIVLSPSLLESSYKYLNGKTVRLPKSPALRPSLKALEWHRKQAGL